MHRALHMHVSYPLLLTHCGARYCFSICPMRTLKLRDVQQLAQGALCHELGELGREAKSVQLQILSTSPPR